MNIYQIIFLMLSRNLRRIKKEANNMHGKWMRSDNERAPVGDNDGINL